MIQIPEYTRPCQIPKGVNRSSAITMPRLSQWVAVNFILPKASEILMPGLPCKKTNLWTVKISLPNFKGETNKLHVVL